MVGALNGGAVGAGVGFVRFAVAFLFLAALARASCLAWIDIEVQTLLRPGLIEG